MVAFHGLRTPDQVCYSECVCDEVCVAGVVVTQMCLHSDIMGTLLHYGGKNARFRNVSHYFFEEDLV